MFREYSPVQGRWTSPDPAGKGAASLGSPQTWNRNVETANALQAQNPKYEYLKATDPNHKKEIERIAEDFRRDGHVDRRVLIGLPGSELSRARGGPRCMTMPLQRDPLV